MPCCKCFNHRSSRQRRDAAATDGHRRTIQARKPEAVVKAVLELPGTRRLLKAGMAAKDVALRFRLRLRPCIYPPAFTTGRLLAPPVHQAIASERASEEKEDMKDFSKAKVKPREVYLPTSATSTLLVLQSLGLPA